MLQNQPNTQISIKLFSGTYIRTTVHNDSWLRGRRVIAGGAWQYFVFQMYSRLKGENPFAMPLTALEIVVVKGSRQFSHPNFRSNGTLR